MKKQTCFLLLLVLTLLVAACAAPSQPQTTTAPELTTAPTTAPQQTEPPITDPPVTEPPVTEPPVTEPPPAHEKFDASKCANLLGTWSKTMTLDNSFLNFEYFSGKTSFTMYYSFDENGYFRIYADKKEFENAIDTFEALVIDHMVELRYVTFKGQKEWQGIADETEILAMWQDGPEVEARNDCEEFVATLNLYHRYVALMREGQYYVQGGTLYTQLEEDTFEASAYSVRSGSLTLTNTDNPTPYQTLKIRFPLVLKAVEEEQ